MKTVKKNVYYCDYCKKKGLSAHYVGKHERRCTANPNRQCGICNTLQGASPNIGEIVEQLKKRFKIIGLESDGVVIELQCKWTAEPVTLDEISKMVEGCPNCILAILRQTKLNYKCCGIEFDYAAEFKKAMYEVDSANSQEQYIDF